MNNFTQTVMDMQDIGVYLRTNRKNLKLTLRETAEQINIPHSVLWGIERDKNCTLSSAIKIMKWLDTL